jgi:hypothetical protein
MALLAPATARAELFADLYLGGAATENTRAAVRAFGVPELHVKNDFDPSIAVGGRVGFWIPSVNDIGRLIDGYSFLGIAADVSYFAADQDDSGSPDIYVVPISFLALLRLPLAKSDEFPHGRVQPYAGLGPSLFMSNFDIGPFEDTSADIGLDGRAGFRFHITPLIALFAEYRFTHFTPEFRDLGIQIKLDLDTHHGNAGIGFSF